MLCCFFLLVVPSELFFRRARTICVIRKTECLVECRQEQLRRVRCVTPSPPPFSR